MKKKLLILCNAVIVGLIAGCGKTPENSVGAESVTEVAAETDVADASAPEENAPETQAEVVPAYKTYVDANGWQVTYDANVIEQNRGDGIVTFVYMGESAGTNMVTVTYEPSTDAKTYADELKSSWGESAKINEGTFPGTEDVKGYWVILDPSKEGSGLYETAIVRDYMEGILSFELTGHNSGDDAIDIPVSDNLAMIIDSLEFLDYEGTAVNSDKIPAYEYPGPELFYSVLYKYMTDELGKGYPKSDVCIPCPVIVKVDESDKDDIRVYGDFWVFNYDLSGDILENTSGGSYPGCIHVKLTDEGYEVVSMDVTEDGSGYSESAKKIFGEYYDDFSKLNSDEKEREKIRAQIIANYVYDNNLDIKAYKDFGWDPVSLPEQNIDSFYSKLD